ncbi:MAG: hypothetical protein JG764_970 [Clostridiales bacterium]|nr:hypothetical protein [Clostridiales bacterium]
MPYDNSHQKQGYNGYVSAVKRMKDNSEKIKEAIKMIFTSDRVSRFSAEQIPTRREAVKQAGRAAVRFLSAVEDRIFEICGLIGNDAILRFQRSYQREVADKMVVRKEESRSDTAQVAEKSVQKETVRIVDLETQKGQNREGVARRESAEKINIRSRESGIER